MPEFDYAGRVLSALPGPHSDAAATEVIAFDDGMAYPEALPRLAALAESVLGRYRTEVLQYGPGKGLPELREWVAHYLGGDGVRSSAEHVLIVNGAKHGLDLVCRIFLNPGDSIVVTTPTYQTALPIFRAYEANFIEVPQDAEGLLVADLEDRLHTLRERGQRVPKFVYNVPEFHNPTGVTMSERRRIALVDAARRWGFLIVEDDPYRRIRFEGTSVRPIQAFDDDGWVIGVGTFAKIIAPGLRVGWVNAAPEIIEKMSAFKSDGGTCPLTQRLVLEYARSGQSEPHIQSLRRTYAKHRDVMLTSLLRDIPGATVAKPEGGYYLWVRLPEAIDTRALLPVAQRHGVTFLPSGVFYASTGPSNYLRLAYSYASAEQITSGMGRLAAAVADLTAGGRPVQA